MYALHDEHLQCLISLALTCDCPLFSPQAIQKNPAFVQLRRIEAAKDIANTIVSSTNKVYLSADSLMINTLGDETKVEAPAATKQSSSLF